MRSTTRKLLVMARLVASSPTSGYEDVIRVAQHPRTRRDWSTQDPIISIIRFHAAPAPTPVERRTQRAADKLQTYHISSSVLETIKSVLIFSLT